MFTGLAVALLLQDTAANLLKKVEAKYADAKTFSVTMDARLTSTGEGKFGEEGWKGTFSSKGDGQVRMEVLGTTKWTLASDGKSLSFTIDKKPPEKKATPPALATWLRRYSARAGLYGVMSSAHGAIFKPKAPKFESLYVVGEVVDGGTESVAGVECRIVKCKFVPPEPKAAPLACRLWIDSKNLVLVQRETVKKSGAETTTLVETFAKPAFDEEIADEVFKVP